MGLLAVAWVRRALRIAWSGVGMVVTHDPVVGNMCLLGVINSPAWVETGGGRAVYIGNSTRAATSVTVGVGSKCIAVPLVSPGDSWVGGTRVRHHACSGKLGAVVKSPPSIHP